MIIMVKRNLKRYFRDRSSVFFSILSILIIFALYIFFLGDTMTEDLKNVTGAKFLMDSWVMAGILSIAGVSTTLSVFGIMIEDNANKISNDFLTSPIKRYRLAGGYILSAYFVGVIMSIFTFIIAEVYIKARGGQLLSAESTVKVLGIILLSVASSSALTFFMVSFFNSNGAFATASTIVGTAIGFITGIYIPIGSLDSSIQFVVKIFPVSYSGSLLRQVMMEEAISKTFASAPAATVETFKRNMGVFYQFGDQIISTQFSILILIATTVLFYGIVVFKLSRKKL